MVKQNGMHIPTYKMDLFNSEAHCLSLKFCHFGILNSQEMNQIIFLRIIIVIIMLYFLGIFLRLTKDLRLQRSEMDQSRRKSGPINEFYSSVPKY